MEPEAKPLSVNSPIALASVFLTTTQSAIVTALWAVRDEPVWLKAILVITLAGVSVGGLAVVWRYADTFSDTRRGKPK